MQYRQLAQYAFMGLWCRVPAMDDSSISTKVATMALNPFSLLQGAFYIVYASIEVHLIISVLADMSFLYTKILNCKWDYVYENVSPPPPAD